MWVAGDHCYKRNTELPLHEQMISPQPDLETTTLTDDDEFIVLACDGIWYVYACVKQPMKKFVVVKESLLNAFFIYLRTC
jgi:serine/threonine protein phosphatase PrpC